MFTRGEMGVEGRVRGRARGGFLQGECKPEIGLGGNTTLAKSRGKVRAKRAQLLSTFQSFTPRRDTTRRDVDSRLPSFYRAPPAGVCLHVVGDLTVCLGGAACFE